MGPRALGAQVSTARKRQFSLRSDHPVATAAAAAEPFTFEAAGHDCLAWYHGPTRPWRDLVLVLCGGVGHEAVNGYATQVQLARALAHAGFPVVRFDYPGMGDAAGSEEAGVEDWRAALDAAIAHARRVSGASDVALLGVRLGATLALEAACRLGSVHALVLWAPLARGRAFVRELMAAGVHGADGSLHAFGHRYPARTLDCLSGIDLRAPRVRPAAHVLVVERDDLPAGCATLAESLRGTGARVDQQAWPGFGRMAMGGIAGALDDRTLAALADWLGRSVPFRVDLPAEPCWPQPAWRAGAWRERLLRVGPGHLCGVLSEPLDSVVDDAKPLVLLPNVGDNYRAGPHRLCVHLARELAAQGRRVFRFDFTGMGDSPPAGHEPAQLYAQRNIDDLRTVMDALGAHGAGGFVVVGLCSGAWAAFRCALVDHRVRGLALLNTRLLEWSSAMREQGWETAPELHVRSVGAYARAAARPHNWRRFLRGEFDLSWLLPRMSSMVAASRVRIASSLRRGEPALRARMRRLCRDYGVAVLALVADDDVGRGYMDHHFGTGGRALRDCPNFAMRYVPDADHTFSRPGNEAHVGAELAHFLGVVQAGLRDWPPAHQGRPGGAVQAVRMPGRTAAVRTPR